MTHLKAAIFDLDGTLLNTLEDLADSANYALKSKGLPIHIPNDYKLFLGMGAYNLIYNALPKNMRTQDKIEYFLEIFRQHYKNNWKNKTKPYKGIYEILKNLNQKNIKIAVLSNKPDKFTQLCVNHFFKDIKFEIILGEKYDIPKKPDPKGALFISDMLNMEPTKIVFIGDSEIDIKTAYAANMFPVAVNWGFRSKHILSQNKPAKMISNPYDVMELFK